jgi:hypothetical protein
MRKKHKTPCPNVTNHIWIDGNGAWMGGTWDMGACGLKHSPETCHVSRLADPRIKTHARLPSKLALHLRHVAEMTPRKHLTLRAVLGKIKVP